MISDRSTHIHREINLFGILPYGELAAVEAQWIRCGWRGKITDQPFIEVTHNIQIYDTYSLRLNDLERL